MNKRLIGSSGEDIAINYIKSQGYKLVNHNFYTKHGEIDLVYYDNSCLCFCEVKYRSSAFYGSSIEAVNFSKQKKIIKAAKVYMYIKNISPDIHIRFDVIGIDEGKITFIKNAF